MSDEGQPPESPEDALRSLTSLDFGPSWARGDGESKTGEGAAKEKRRREGGDQDRRDERRGKGRRDDRRGGDGRRREGRRDDRRDDRRGDRRDGDRGGKGGRFDKGDRDRGDRRGKYQKGRGRRDDDRGRPQRSESPPPEGVTANVMPVEEGLDGLAKEILAGGRTYSVFDLAKLVLGARERFNVNFKSAKEGGLIRCKKDGALWLSKQEAVQHFWRADWRKDYYEEVVADTDPPRGNFQTIGRCGISGELLGPPNYHGYQPAVAQLHRERFGHMSLEAYKRKIRMERGEEVVNAWLEKMSKRVRFRPTGGVRAEEKGAKAEEAAPSPSAAESEESASAAEAEQSGESPADDQNAEASIEEAGQESDAEGTEEPEATEAEETEETVAEGEEPGSDDSNAADAPEAGDSNSDEPLLEDSREVERHFVENHFDDAYHVTNRAWVGGNIPGNRLSPGLLTLLRETVAEERRYPGKLTPMLCRQLSGRHVAVFKWRRKLKAGPSRPHPVPDDIAIADRPRSLLEWITENSGKKLELLWKHFLPNKVSDEEKLGWYHDLHWLLNQGYVLLMADSTIHLAKKPDGGGGEGREGKARTKKKAGAKAPSKERTGDTPGSKPSASSGPVVVRKRGSSGLYALGGRSLRGAPKSPDSLTGKGLWPSRYRLEAVASDEKGVEEEDEGGW